MKNKILIGILLIAAIGISATVVNYTRLESNLSVGEKVTLGSVSQVITHDLLNETVTYKQGASKYDVDLVYADTTTGTQTVDLTDLTNTLGESLSMDGYRVVAAKFKSRLTNTGTIVIEPGDATPYNIFGSAFKLTLEPGQSFLYKADTVLTDVSSTAKNIKFTCGGDTLDWIIVTANLE